MSFAARLRALRHKRGWSQAELARRAGLQRQSVARLEQGRRQPAWPTVQAIALALGVEVTALQDPPEGTSD